MADTFCNLCNLEDFLLIWSCLCSLTFFFRYIVLLVIFSREYFIKKNFLANKGNENPSEYCARIELYLYPGNILSYKQNEEPDLKVLSMLKYAEVLEILTIRKTHTVVCL